VNNLKGKTIKSYVISDLKVSITFTDGTTFWIEPTEVHQTLATGITMPVQEGEK